MTGNQDVIAALNRRLVEEVGAVNQYMIHAEMAANWGYGKLHADIRKHAMDEMRHAESLIERILFLDGTPAVTEVPVRLGETVPEIVTLGLADELAAVEQYNATIALALEAGDNGTRDLLAGILGDEEGHVDWSEAQQTMIEQLGLQTYLNARI